LPIGQLTLNNVTDEQFSKLIQIKDKAPGKTNIPSNQSITPTTIGSKTGFSNIVLVFSDPEGFKVAAEILEMLGA